MLKNIRKVAPKHCDNCGAKYTPRDFKVLKLVENSALIHLNCSACANTYVINAYVNQNGLSSQRVPLILDLESTDEVEKFAQQNAISKNNAIDLFNLLSNNTSIEQLFSTDKKQDQPLRKV